MTPRTIRGTLVLAPADDVAAPPVAPRDRQNPIVAGGAMAQPPALPVDVGRRPARVRA